MKKIKAQYVILAVLFVMMFSSALYCVNYTLQQRARFNAMKVLKKDMIVLFSDDKGNMTPGVSIAKIVANDTASLQLIVEYKETLSLPFTAEKIVHYSRVKQPNLSY